MNSSPLRVSAMLWAMLWLPFWAAPARAQLVEPNQLGVRMSHVHVSLSPSGTPPQPTKGRALDHIGFDAMNLEAFVASLEAKGIKIGAPIRQVSDTKVKVAFLTDPFGTYIELTEGLSPE